MKVFVTPNVMKHLWQNYDPDKQHVGFLVATKDKDGRWVSSLSASVGDEIVYSIVGEDSNFKELTDYLHQRKDNVKFVPLFSYGKKELDENAIRFLKDAAKHGYQDMIIMKPTEQPGKRHFVVECYNTKGDEISHEPVEITNKLSEFTEFETRGFMNKYTTTLKKICKTNIFNKFSKKIVS